jgi:DNA-binding CsgD family transcriptional regulator
MATAVLEAGPDLIALADLVSMDRTDVPSEGVPLSLLGDLMDQVPSDRISVVGFDTGRSATWFRQGVLADRSPEQPLRSPQDEMLGRAHWATSWDCLSCGYPGRDDRRSVTAISDYYSPQEWHATGMYRDVYRPLGLEHQISVGLTSTSGPGSRPLRSLRMFFFRGPGPDFAERDRAVLKLLLPHLRHAYREAELRRRGRPKLTPRQWDLLRLVSAGHTNIQIARRLSISEGTVRKHLENIYSRLGVTSRTAAVTRAFPEQSVL